MPSPGQAQGWGWGDWPRKLALVAVQAGGLASYFAKKPCDFFLCSEPSVAPSCQRDQVLGS